MNDDGTMARVPQLEDFCARHGLKMISVAELIRYRMKHESVRAARGRGLHRDRFGEFRAIAYASDLNPEYHVALVRGEVAGKERVLVRMHARCLYRRRFRLDELRLRPPGARFAARHRRRGVRRAGLSARNRTGLPRGARRPRRAAHGLPRPRFHALSGRAGQRQLQHEHGIGAQILSDLGCTPSAC